MLDEQWKSHSNFNKQSVEPYQNGWPLVIDPAEETTQIHMTKKNFNYIAVYNINLKRCENSFKKNHLNKFLQCNNNSLKFIM